MYVVLWIKKKSFVLQSYRTKSLVLRKERTCIEERAGNHDLNEVSENYPVDSPHVNKPASLTCLSFCVCSSVRGLSRVCVDSCKKMESDISCNPSQVNMEKEKISILLEKEKTIPVVEVKKLRATTDEQEKVFSMLTALCMKMSGKVRRNKLSRRRMKNE